MQSEMLPIRAQRLNRGLSIAAASELAGVTPRQWQSAETGSVPQPRNAFKIAGFLGYRVTDLWPVESNGGPREAA